MKKLILSMVFVFASFAMVNANSNTKSDDTDNSIVEYPGCTADAWRYGTEMGGGDPEEEYFYTSLYSDLFC